MKTVLVVEDDRIVGHELKSSLTAFGYRVPPIATSHDAALAAAEKEAPDLVLMDIHLEGEQDGIETAGQLQSRFDVPVVFLTGSSDEDNIHRAKEIAPYGYLLKPVKSVELRNAVEIALFKHAHDRQLRERWFAAVLRCVDDGVIATGVDGNVRFLNQVAERFTGFTTAEATGRPVEQIFSMVDESSGEKRPTATSGVRQGQGSVTLPEDTLLVRRGGAMMPIDGSAAPVADEQGNLVGAVIVFRDATERRRSQSNLLVTDRMVSMGMLAAGVAHEINNPLASVMANAEFAAQAVVELSARFNAPEHVELVEALRDVRDGADRIRRIVRDLKIFSRSEEERRTQIDVSRVMDSALRLAWNQVRHRAHLVKDYGTVPLVEMSEARLGQVFLNLVINAAQAIPEGRADTNEIRITTETSPEGRAVVRVSDTGEGMSRETLGRLFQPFFTTKPVGVGTGLGLPLCHRILTEAGGTIAFESTFGKGTTVEVTLQPVTKRAGVAEELVRSVAPPASQLRRGRVLVVDDEPTIAAAFRRALVRSHDVTPVLRGEEALTRIRGGERFDVIFCDLMMPQMTGMDLHARLLAEVPEQASSMVFVTGGAFTPRGREFLDEVPNQRIEKPFVLRQILALVNERVRGA